MPRRVPDYPDAFYAYNKIASWGSYISAWSILVFSFVLYESFSRRKKKSFKQKIASEIFELFFNVEINGSMTTKHFVFLMAFSGVFTRVFITRHYVWSSFLIIPVTLIFYAGVVFLVRYILANKSLGDNLISFLKQHAVSKRNNSVPKSHFYSSASSLGKTPSGHNYQQKRTMGNCSKTPSATPTEEVPRITVTTEPGIVPNILPTGSELQDIGVAAGRIQATNLGEGIAGYGIFHALGELLINEEPQPRSGTSSVIRPGEGSQNRGLADYLESSGNQDPNVIRGIRELEERQRFLRAQEEERPRLRRHHSTGGIQVFHDENRFNMFSNQRYFPNRQHFSVGGRIWFFGCVLRGGFQTAYFIDDYYRRGYERTRINGVILRELLPQMRQTYPLRPGLLGPAGTLGQYINFGASYETVLPRSNSELNFQSLEASAGDFSDRAPGDLSTIASGSEEQTTTTSSSSTSSPRRIV